jgi:amino acid adenylation domain-containing protein
MTALLSRRRPAVAPRRPAVMPFQSGAPFVPFREQDREQAISHRFEEQVRLHEGRLAVKSGDEVLTYGALNRFANRIARAIVARRGAGSEPVLLLMDKEPAVFAAIFGALKAAKFYVPLSPTYPEARNAFIAQDSEARLIVTDEKNVAAARQLAGGSLDVLNVSDVDPDGDGSDLGLAISPDDFAYILYTSGSTGQPKGVVEKHRNVLQNARRVTNDHRLTVEDRLSCVASVAFSSSLKDIYGALLNGAALFPLDLEREGPAALADFLSRERITFFNVVVTVFRHFVAGLEPVRRFPHLRVVRLGSEAVTRKDVELFREHFAPPCVLANGYGATETGTSRLNVVNHDTELQGNTLPIGYAVDGSEILLLDQDGNAVGFNRVGEIAVKSAYLSPGYWKRPELTSAVFLPDPDGGERRIYRTGDLGLMAEDGCLVYAGRKDFQVKVRGHRVEIAEIEMALTDSPGVKEAAVVKRADLPEERSLVAYLVAREGTAPPPVNELRTFLKGRLAESAVPSAFVFLDVLPVTATGKLDRKALPAPPPERPALDVPYSAPQGETQLKLVQIWEDLLKIRPVGVRDNFFDLGGNSLLAAQLFLQVSRVFGKDISPAVLFEGPTVEQLAQRVERHKGPERPCLVPIQPAGGRPPFFCVHGIGGEVIEFARVSRHLGTEQPFYGFQCRGVWNHDEPRRTIEEMATGYIEELVRFQPEGPYYLGGFSCGAAVAYEMAQQLRAQGREVALLALIDQRRPNLDPDFAWSREGILNFLRNFHAWFREDFLKSGVRDLLMRARLKAGVFKRYLASLVGLRPKGQPHAGDIFDLEQIPAIYRNLLETNYHALRNYVPRPYPGRTVLLQASAQPLFRWNETCLGWNKLLTGPVEVKIVTGGHNSIMAEPRVGGLAGALAESLEQARVSET